MAELLTVAFFVGLAVLAILIWRGTKRQNDWGITFAQVSCPKCGTPLPRVRKPASVREALWGGHTCPNCGTRSDKRGRAL